MSPTSNSAKQDRSVKPQVSASSGQSSKKNSSTHQTLPNSESDTYSETYFDALYSDNADPWHYQTRWYEKRKRDICLAVLPQPQYDHAIELGCGNGVFSELLAKRCQALTSLDGNKNAVQLAKQRLAQFSHVEVVQGVIPAALFVLDEHLSQSLAQSGKDESLNNDSFSKGLLAENTALDGQSANQPTYDMIVISEILYYLSADDIDTVIVWIKHHLAIGGTLLCCHWRYAIDGFAMNGDLVHQRLQQAFDSANSTTTNDKESLDVQLPQVAFTHQTKLEESDFLLDVWLNATGSVAMQENLV